jgi:hypothetical protein
MVQLDSARGQGEGGSLTPVPLTSLPVRHAPKNKDTNACRWSSPLRKMAQYLPRRLHIFPCS